MDQKANALKIIRFDKPERVSSGPPSHRIHYRGCNHEGYQGGGHDCAVGTVWTDVWNTTWRKELDGVMGFPQTHPLAHPSALRSYKWPDANDEAICGPIYQGAGESPGREVFLCGSHRETLWEKAYMLVGMEDLMTYLFTEPNYAAEIFHRVMDFQLAIAKHYLAVGIEIAGLGDDLGTQNGPLLGQDICERFLVSEYRRLFDLYKSRGVIINFHSCGKIESSLDMFMDLGVDILNPVQATANDLDLVRRKTRGKMTLQGAISTGAVMAGPPQAIVGEVRRRMWQLGRDGGYFCSPDQGMPFPPENIEALNQAIDQFGLYPLAPVDGD